jgi:hypothetical protein
MYFIAAVKVTGVAKVLTVIKFKAPVVPFGGVNPRSISLPIITPFG